MYTCYRLNEVGEIMTKIYLSTINDEETNISDFININKSRIYKIRESILSFDDDFIGDKFFRLADSIYIDSNFGIYMHTLYQNNELHFLPELKFYGNNLLILPNFLMERIDDYNMLNNDYFLNGYDEIEFDEIQHYFTKNNKELAEINEKINNFNQKIYSELENKHIIKNTGGVILDLWRH